MGGGEVSGEATPRGQEERVVIGGFGHRPLSTGPAACRYDPHARGYERPRSVRVSHRPPEQGHRAHRVSGNHGSFDTQRPKERLELIGSIGFGSVGR